MESRGCRLLDHTADVALECWAPDEAAVLVEAARALVALMTGGAAIARRDTRAVTLSSLDPEDRLVEWLNEVIYAAVTDGFVLADAQVTLREGGLDAAMTGEAQASDRVTGELKSVTYHHLALWREAGVVRCRVVVDV